MAGRVSQVLLESVDLGATSQARVSQVLLESVDLGGTSQARVTQLFVEVIDRAPIGGGSSPMLTFVG